MPETQSRALKTHILP